MFLILPGIVLFLWSLVLALVDHGLVSLSAQHIVIPSGPFPPSAQLGIASEIYLISLPSRQDRRHQMEHLREFQGIEWTVVDALDPSDIAISHIFDWIASQRLLQPVNSDTVFRWPANINALATSTEFLEPFGADFWTSADARDHATSSPSSIFPHLNVTCATHDHYIPPSNHSLPDWMILTAPKISCWNSHVLAIRQFIDRGNATTEDVAVFLEDDIDMEKDIDLRMRHVWNFLPPGWDIVFLGMYCIYSILHCLQPTSCCIIQVTAGQTNHSTLNFYHLGSRLRHMMRQHGRTSIHRTPLVALMLTHFPSPALGVFCSIFATRLSRTLELSIRLSVGSSKVDDYVLSVLFRASSSSGRSRQVTYPLNPA